MEKQSPCMMPALKVHRLACFLEKRADQALQEKLDITFSQCMILHSLWHNPDCSQQCIAKCRDLTQAAVSRQIDALRTKKLLLRKENERNRREHILHMTEKGEEVLSQALKVVQKTFDGIFGTLPEKEMLTMEKSLEKVLDSLKKEGDCGCDD